MADIVDLLRGEPHRVPSGLALEAAAEIERLRAAIKAVKQEVHDCGFMIAYHDPEKPTLAIRPGCGEIVRKIYGLT